MMLTRDELVEKRLIMARQDKKVASEDGCLTERRNTMFEIVDETGNTIGTVCRPERTPRFGHSQETLYLCRGR